MKRDYICECGGLLQQSPIPNQDGRFTYYYCVDCGGVYDEEEATQMNRLLKESEDTK